MLMSEWPCVLRCGTCASWRGGECWSADRLDGTVSSQSAGSTTSRMTCEAWEDSHVLESRSLMTPTLPARLTEGEVA